MAPCWRGQETGHLTHTLLAVHSHAWLEGEGKPECVTKAEHNKKVCQVSTWLENDELFVAWDIIDYINRTVAVLSNLLSPRK